MSEVILVFTTVPDDARAEPFARALVDERLAACVHLHAPMTSVYRWKGEVTGDRERQVVVKTTRERLPALEARLTTLHPYELPELVVVAADGGSAAYLEWVRDEVRP